MYLLYLDESGAHVGSPTFVLAGIAIHEHDVWHLQRKITRAIEPHLPPGVQSGGVELHAYELKSPKIRDGRSPWRARSLAERLQAMEAIYTAIAAFRGLNQQYPPALFGAAVSECYPDRERRAYEEVLHRFDEMLARRAVRDRIVERGIVIHDRRVVELDLQKRVDAWRHVAGRIGRLTHLVDVPFFTDSRASRLVQVADFVAWGLNRYYTVGDPQWAEFLWKRFDSLDGIMHGLAHVCPEFALDACGCPPCVSRGGSRTA